MASVKRLFKQAVIQAVSAACCVGAIAYLSELTPSAAQTRSQLSPLIVSQPAPDPKTVEAIAKHLRSIGAKVYGAYWCPHCRAQKAVFGEALFNRYIHYIECDPRGRNAQPKLCTAAKIEGYPTWVIKGKVYPGAQSLEQLARLSGFQGRR